MLPLAVTAAAGGWYALGVVDRLASSNTAPISYDIYNELLPNIQYALRSLQRGEGFFWMNVQNCGQPFFALIHIGLLNPVNVFFALLDMPSALLAIVIANLTLAGISMYWLCRRYGISIPGALCGALAFELGGVALQLASWVPTNGLGAYALLPAVFATCECVIEKPTLRGVAGLGVILALQFLAGQPQMSLFTCQLIGLRVLWEAGFGDRSRLARALVPLVLSGILALALAAVQLIPSAEITGLSLRGDRPLTLQERNPGVVSWVGFRQSVGVRSAGWGSLFAVVPAALAAATAARRRKNRLPLFFLTVGLLSGMLAFVTPVYELYSYLPLGSMFRFQQRFLWITAFAISLLVAFGAEAIIQRPDTRPDWKGMVLLSLGVAGFWLLSPSGLRNWEWWLFGAMGVAVGIRWMWPHAGWVPQAALPALVGINMAIVGTHPIQVNVKDLSIYRRHEDAFAFVKQLMTLQDRIDHVGPHMDFSLMEKSATIFDVRAVRDYEPLTSIRYGELMVVFLKTSEAMARLRDGKLPMVSINETIFFTDILPRSRPLLNLFGARYVLVDLQKDDSAQVLPGLRLLRAIGGVRIYENPTALQRASFVPSLTVIGDPVRLLQILTSSEHDPRQTVLVEAAPDDGFVGSPSGASGTVEIVSDRGEEVVIQSRASDEGFVFLSDQFYPGWDATVNDVPTPIVRANYAFRAVRVPAGDARVVFRYRPMSLRLGAAVSALGMLCAGLCVYAGRPRRTRS
jgi:hypothetical protein